MSNILLVDDSTATREKVAPALEARGHKVLHAANGAEGLKIAKSRAVHLIITDLTMPTLDGISLIRALRASREHAETPILILTATRGRSHDEAMEAGATTSLIKPFDEEESVKVVQRLLGRLG